MREAILQSIQNLRANKLRSFLTMFGILWGMISVVVLSATGEALGWETSVGGEGDWPGRSVGLSPREAEVLALRERAAAFLGL